MNTHPSKLSDQRRGSIYLVVLVVVAAVTTMVLVGTSLRRTSAEQYRAMDDRTRVRHAARSATETALAYMSDEDTFLASAKAGKSYSETVGKSTITVRAIDKDTRGLATDSTSTLLVTASAETDDARSLISFDVPVPVSYIKMLGDKGASSYLALDEAKEASVAVDQIGKVNGTYLKPSNVGKIEFPDGEFAPEIGNDNENVEIPHDSSFETTEGTIVIWALIYDMSKPEQQTLFSKETSRSGDFEIACYVSNRSLHLRINSQNSFLDRNYSIDISSKDDKQWHQFVYSFGKGGTRIYVDGVRVEHDSFYAIGFHYSYLGYSETNTYPWYLGARRRNGTPSDPIMGSVARFAFFPVQLADSEIVELMDAQIPSFEPVEGSFVRVVE